MKESKTKCACFTWAYEEAMGRYINGHHPKCPEGHPSDCGCLYCLFERIPMAQFAVDKNEEKGEG